MASACRRGVGTRQAVRGAAHRPPLNLEWLRGIIKGMLMLGTTDRLACSSPLSLVSMLGRKRVGRLSITKLAPLMVLHGHRLDLGKFGRRAA